MKTTYAPTYPRNPFKEFEINIKDNQSNLIELQMFDESDTLGYLLVHIFLQNKKYITCSSFRMSHPFAIDSQQKTRIAYILIGFKEKMSISQYNHLIETILQNWKRNYFMTAKESFKKLSSSISR